MNVFVSGATGFIGRALVLRLLRDRHHVTAWVRDAERARQTLGYGVELVSTGAGELALSRALSAADVVINLAGAPIVDKRWTEARRRELWNSRVGVTERLVAAMASCSPRPRALVSASAIGFYGDRGDERLDEGAAPGDGFAADLCRSWELAAGAARQLGVRVATARIGVVLGPEGGMLAALEPIYRLGLGGPMAGGEQWVPWIHLDDVVEALVFAATDERIDGPVNLVGPTLTRQAELSRALGATLGRPAVIPAPRFAVKQLKGDRADLLLASTAVVPQLLLNLGFRFRFSAVQEAIADVLATDDVEFAQAPQALPASPYLRDRPPRYQLTQDLRVGAPLAEVFDFFAAAENLTLLTPPNLSFNILSPTPIEMAAGAEINYRIRLGPAPMRWTTVIEAWQPAKRFVDVQMAGPYASWWHEHTFEADGGATIVRDRVLYRPPLGVLGRLANAVFVEPMLRRIFAFRRSAIRLRFGVPERARSGHRAVAGASLGS